MTSCGVAGFFLLNLVRWSPRFHEAAGIWRQLRKPVLAADSHVAALGLEILHTEKETIFICNFEPSLQWRWKTLMAHQTFVWWVGIFYFNYKTQLLFDICACSSKYPRFSPMPSDGCNISYVTAQFNVIKPWINLRNLLQKFLREFLAGSSFQYMYHLSRLLMAVSLRQLQS